MKRIHTFDMEGITLIGDFRDYLDYLEEHLINVKRAFNELSCCCRDQWWVEDQNEFESLRIQVLNHDLSKFSKEEFTAYSNKWFHVKGNIASEKEYLTAWDHHKLYNPHHFESLTNDLDVVHMAIDWTAMGYKFNDTAEEYYRKNQHSMKLNTRQKEILTDIFAAVRGH